MTPDRWKLVEGLFENAAALDPTERMAYLDRECGSDPELRAEVDSLLAYDRVPLRTMEQLVESEAAKVAGAGPAVTGDRVGPWLILRTIGEGGMGTVYEAVRDDDQYRKRVALKLIRRGMVNETVQRRFRNERQILATLEHPYIARLVDGGDWQERPGKPPTPYLAMEFVDGEPITRFSEAKALSIAARLKLFLEVLAAVSFAHQKLIVHRDLKPSNIYVAADGTPRLLDFGIAKLLDEGSLEELAMATATMAHVMTPDYASPEQVRGETSGTSTDVYSLGLILFELLTGKRAQPIENYSAAEIYRIVCEREVPLASVAAPEKGRALRGDLDVIVARAVHKDPARRYASVEQFSRDIRRYLEGRPVLARKDTLAYRAGKFIRRNRVAAVLGSLLVAALATGVVTTSIQARRAERRFAALRKISNRFLFQFHDEIAKVPGTTAARAMVVETALEYLDSLAREAGGDPSLLMEVAEAYGRVGDVQGFPTEANLGRTADAEASYRRAISMFEDLRRRGAPGDQALRKQIFYESRLSALLQYEGKEQEAVALGQQAARHGRELPAAGTDNASVLGMTETGLGDLLLGQGKVTEALHCYERGAAFRREAAKSGILEHRMALATSYNRLAWAYRRLGDLVKALTAFQEDEKIVTDELAKDPASPRLRRHLAVVYQNIGNVYGAANEPSLGDFAHARYYYERMREFSRVLVDADSRDVSARQTLVRAYFKLGEIYKEPDPKRSLEYLAEAERTLAPLGKNSDNALLMLVVELDRVEAWRRLGRLDEARRALVRAEAALGDFKSRMTGSSTPDEAVAEVGASRGDILLAAGDRAGARPLFEKSVAIIGKEFAQTPEDLDTRNSLSIMYDRMAQACTGAEAAEWRTKQLTLWTEWNAKYVRNPFSERMEAEAARLLRAARARG